MQRSSGRYNKVNNIAIVVFGGMFILVSFVCLIMSFMERTKHDRWQDAPRLRETGELRDIGLGNDVTIAGAIAPGTLVAREGLALYEYWEREIYYSGNSKRETWSMASSYKPGFELLFGAHRIAVQGERSAFQRTREVQLGASAKLKGFAPGDEVVVMGTVASTDGAQVQADIVCGGDRDKCLGQMSTGATVALVMAAIAALAGLGLAALGVRRLGK